MINLTNGKVNLKVTKGAYENNKAEYAALGYSLVSNKKDKKDNKENEQKDLQEKPVSQWSKEEIKAYAKEHNIDLSQAKSTDEAREIIAKNIK